MCVLKKVSVVVSYFSVSKRPLHTSTMMRTPKHRGQICQRANGLKCRSEENAIKTTDLRKWNWENAKLFNNPGKHQFKESLNTCSHVSSACFSAGGIVMMSMMFGIFPFFHLCITDKKPHK